MEYRNTSISARSRAAFSLIEVMLPRGVAPAATRRASAECVDIAMVLDECIETPAPREKAETAVKRTSAWAKRARTYFLDQAQCYQGICAAQQYCKRYDAIQSARPPAGSSAR